MLLKTTKEFRYDSRYGTFHADLVDGSTTVLSNGDVIANDVGIECGRIHSLAMQKHEDGAVSILLCYRRPPSESGDHEHLSLGTTTDIIGAISWIDGCNTYHAARWHE